MGVACMSTTCRCYLITSIAHVTCHSSLLTQNTIPDQHSKASTPTDDTVYDDSGVSSSSEQSAGHVTSHMTSHMTGDEASSVEDASSSEKWALVSSLSLTHTHVLSTTHYLIPLGQ